MKKSAGAAFICIMVCGSMFGGGCSSFRSDIHGAYGGDSKKQTGLEPVDVLFLFTHERQAKGFDVIPKHNRPVGGFNDILADAISEFGNVGQYATFTDKADDVNNPERRALRDSLRSSHDYVIHLRFKKETSFAKHVLGTTFSTLSVTLLPVPYGRTFTVQASVRDGDGALVREYDRSASVTTWVQAGLIFLYPFHPEKRKTEEIYVEFLHDVFRQIESDGILVKK